MVLTDIANIAAGAYKGWLNAGGQDVDPTYLLYVLGSTSLLSGLWKSLSLSIMINDDGRLGFSHGMVCLENGKVGAPLEDGVKRGLLKVPIGAIEIVAGYALGYFACKVIS